MNEEQDLNSFTKEELQAYIAELKELVAFVKNNRSAISVVHSAASTTSREDKDIQEKIRVLTLVGFTAGEAAAFASNNSLQNIINAKEYLDSSVGVRNQAAFFTHALKNSLKKSPRFEEKDSQQNNSLVSGNNLGELESHQKQCRAFAEKLLAAIKNDIPPGWGFYPQSNRVEVEGFIRGEATSRFCPVAYYSKDSHCDYGLFLRDLEKACWTMWDTVYFTVADMIAEEKRNLGITTPSWVPPQRTYNNTTLPF